MWFLCIKLKHGWSYTPVFSNRINFCSLHCGWAHSRYPGKVLVIPGMKSFHVLTRKKLKCMKKCASIGFSGPENTDKCIRIQTFLNIFNPVRICEQPLWIYCTCSLMTHAFLCTVGVKQTLEFFPSLPADILPDREVKGTLSTATQTDGMFLWRLVFFLFFFLCSFCRFSLTWPPNGSKNSTAFTLYSLYLKHFCLTCSSTNQGVNI